LVLQTERFLLRPGKTVLRHVRSGPGWSLAIRRPEKRYLRNSRRGLPVPGHRRKFRPGRVHRVQPLRHTESREIVHKGENVDRAEPRPRRTGPPRQTAWVRQEPYFSQASTVPAGGAPAVDPLLQGRRPEAAGAHRAGPLGVVGGHGGKRRRKLESGRPWSIPPGTLGLLTDPDSGGIRR